MNPQPFTKPTGRWDHKLNPRLMRLLRPVRRRTLVRKQRMKHVEVIGAEHLHEARHRQHGILITPNHAFHYDSNVLLEVGDRLGSPLTFMTAWQVFAMANRFNRWLMRRHGCFSVDRDGVDVTACKQAMQIVREGQSPLVIFPEGEIFHSPDRVLPFREGAAAIALGAARKSERPIACMPVAMRVQYLQSPDASVGCALSKMERRLRMRETPQLTLFQRALRCANHLLTQLEIEFLGQRTQGSIADRAERLQQHLLESLERKLKVTQQPEPILERMSSIRRRIIENQSKAAMRIACEKQLNRLFTCTQLLSYTEATVDEMPTIEQTAGFVEKLEEDIYGTPSPTVMGDRRATVTFGEPIMLAPGKSKTTTASKLTSQLQQRVQTLLDQSRESSIAATGSAGGNNSSNSGTTLWKPKGIIPVVRRSSKPR